ncbi:hypothetical protein JR316_0003173 [Psilocybe cubensis]|uniref:Uncharacterized protein n=2 Tax=Psilocybe cubensis TaxID=181762 RepID=A0A8H7Y1J2_PSICU|nr:hypothetical protein JR316_0003173 [Psilocybe cubensis]KAH9483702.1 hypothetical protein JR316_0003173 [Psilocybe cubensis]
MLAHRGFTAWIQVQGKATPEYLVAVDESAHRVSCWIAGEVGQTFTIYWQDQGGGIDTCSFIVLDGLTVPGRFLFGNGIASRGGVRTSMSTERPFMFQKVEEKFPGKMISPTTPSSSNEAGMIILKIKRIRRVARDKPANRIDPAPKTLLGKRKPEDLCIGFGEEVRVHEREDYTYDVVNHENPELKKPSSYVTFVFRYRSKDFLESQGIAVEESKISTLPTPSALPTPNVSRAPSRVVSRRISNSLPPVPRRVSAKVEELDETDTDLSDRDNPSSPYKRPKIETSIEALFPPPDPLFPERSIPYPAYPSNYRRPSAELRRAASWTETVQVPGKDGVYRGDTEFFLPRLNIDFAEQAGLPQLSDFQDIVNPSKRVESKPVVPQRRQRKPQSSQSSQGSSSSISTPMSNPDSPFTDPDDSFTFSK